MNNSSRLTTPVLFLIFNRVDTSRRVFDAIRQARPQQLYIAADGPRADTQGDVEKCAETRKVVEGVDWECDVRTLFRESNYGCGKGVKAAIDWFFQHVEQGIILEDDCLPDQSFFRFCQELLARYCDDTRLMHINGNNFASNKFIDTPFSYHFCSYPQAWGWATWRRAWRLFDSGLSNWPMIKMGDWFRAKYWSADEYNVQRAKFDRMHNLNPDDIWDYCWHFSVFSQSGLVIAPKLNLISNIGFSSAGTHTKSFHPEMSALPTAGLKFPLAHPPFVIADYEIDRVYRRRMIHEPLLRKIAFEIIKRVRGAHG